MSLSIKKTALAAAIGLSISASSVGAFPFWSFTGFGGSSGALGGDNQWAPFDGRYLLEGGSIEFTPDILEEEFVTSDVSDDVQVSPPTLRGTLELQMKLKGRAYDFPDVFPGRSTDIINEDENGVEYIELGDFTFEMSYYNVLFGQDGADLVDNFVIVAAPSEGSYGKGTLTYDTDVVFDDTNINKVWDEDEVDISVDGEIVGDVVHFATPDCAVLDELAVLEDSRSSVTCGDTFFQMIIPANGSEASLFTPVSFYPLDEIELPGEQPFDVGIGFDSILGTPIPTNKISLFHAGLPCPAYDPNKSRTAAEEFYCNPLPDNFPTAGIPVADGSEVSYLDYGEYIGGFNPPGRHAFINALATASAVPAPATGLLLGVGLAGLGFARRRAKARSEK